MSTAKRRSRVRRRRPTLGHALSQRSSTLGPWHLSEILGQGALARVYAARHESSRGGAPYAVKVLRPEWSDRPAVVDLLRREALVGSRVRHENVVPVLAAGLHEPPYYLVMPRLAGWTLEALLTAGRNFPVVQALWIARQIAEGLRAIQMTCGMTHGDVKPGNVFVSPQGRATLLDAGFARAAGENAAIADRPTLCSLAYAAPETLTSVLTVDHRSDIYSLGVTMYRMHSGGLPFDAPDRGRLVELVRTARPACVRELRPELPKPVASLVHRMLAKEPLRRPQSYDELIDELVHLEIDCFANR